MFNEGSSKMGLKTAINFAKLASAYVSENQAEKAMSAALMMLDHIEQAGITPEEFDTIEILPSHDILPSNELSSANKGIANLISKAIN
jgi:hypothetical protein